ncbi:hypothetical protein BY996DRAFT_6695655 [Phakopsora pachyrhizi]|uniref:GPN-loop GTPase n=1 Tax=Phakopsora pachyrhizi TaxID=170000 RepID=A0AAV0AVH0_PHAPC|nr:hypothetical protein BY996DRAFT_6695655 [Phakopsora pachyrhizi]CAH7672162.1 hypothetical protein PPACK8108_LOCUS6961 [Phakopsora pachyrhizi]
MDQSTPQIQNQSQYSNSNDKGKIRSDHTTDSETAENEPVCIICIGMAGSGKTTFVQRLNSYLHSKKKPPYILNLDPAVYKLPFQANIDIRDTVNYKEVMKQYNLGPNGGILTALNLFTTKFDQVLDYIEKRSKMTDYVILDTPGQIEIFTWSASGSIITDAIASSIPTVVAYIIDTPRTTSPATFMSNMLYACSILYKTRLPFILVFNKVDVKSEDFAIEWMKDFEKFQTDLIMRNEQDQKNDVEGGSGYMTSLMNSMSLVLDEFYKNLTAVGCSAMTGQGMKEFFEAVEKSREEYKTDYKPELVKRQLELKDQKENLRKENLNRLLKDLKLNGNEDKNDNSAKKKEAFLKKDDEEIEEDDYDENDYETLDRRDFERLNLSKRRDENEGGDGDDQNDKEVRKRYGVERDGFGGEWPIPR